MTVKMSLALDRGVLMPAVCCACGTDSAGSTYTIKRTGSDLKGKHYVTLEFPLCEDCGRIGEQTRATGFFQRRKQANAEELKAQHKALKHRRAAVNAAASIPSVHYSFSGHGSIKLELKNERFAQAFGLANGILVPI